MNRHMFRKTFWGLSLIGLGLVFLLDRLQLIDFGVRDVIFMLWPLILLEIGLNELLFKCKRDVGGWIMTILGVYFIGRNLGFYDYSIGDLIRLMIPLWLVFFGFRLMSGKGKSHKRRQNYDYSGMNGSDGMPGSSTYTPPTPPPPPAPSSLDDLFDEKLGHQYAKGAEQRHEAEASDHASFGSRPEPSEGQPGHGPNLRKEPLHARRPDQDPMFRQYGSMHADHWKQNKQHFKEHIRNMKHQKQWHHDQWKKQFKSDHQAYNNKYGSEYDASYGAGVDAEERSSFIGDVHIGKDYFELKPMNISHFIGDTMLDLTRAQIPYGKTRINISAFIGDVKVFIPSGVEVSFKAEGNSFIGDMDILNRNSDGMMNRLSGETSEADTTGKRVEITVNVFIGDIRINRVG
ncbi:cell wall-active antibiotics response protein LiaF [Paenibacillus hunanensis]|uniref:cell wall-active antibiotics response protein LiaF n=1 Tax=Paenibacillus hunanensis TaxID=539262 RepID=UPI002A6A0B9A|nr:cell wall-active antibiotics response protein LiaF [Paenibacillus hunanensis]WPP40206.1 cell wall-active antibiotics response protein LiaF [Paenibacillus hunanensis]